MSLITIQVLTAVSYKLSQTGGSYQYSTASALVVSEGLKWLLSVVLFCTRQVKREMLSVRGVLKELVTELSWLPVTTDEPGSPLRTRGGERTLVIDIHPQSSASSFSSQDTLPSQRFSRSFQLISRLFLLALFYSLNNNAYFIIYQLADPASITLLKSASTLLSALFTFTLLSRTLMHHQYLCLVLQMCGLLTMQWDPCKNTALYPWGVYVALGVMVGFSAFCSVWNEMVLKGFPTCSLHAQNIALYTFGVVLNLAIFFLEPALHSFTDQHVLHTSNGGNSESDLGTAAYILPPLVELLSSLIQRSSTFFDHYTLPVLLIIACNSLVGIAVTSVYKYADAITKNIANSLIAVILLVVSVLFFGLSVNVTMAASAVVVITANYLYFTVGRGAGGTVGNVVQVRKEEMVYFNKRNLKVTTPPV
jgi:hypothetical protein